jgi:CheY-like chemotaxis protein
MLSVRGPAAVSSPVLLIDDDTDSVQAFVLFLKYHGVEAVTAEDGDQALALLRGGLTPCLIILDLMMPGKDGFAFRSEQLADPGLKNIPIVVCSAAYDGRGAAGRMGAVNFVQKPAEPQALLAIVKQYCPG